MLYHNQQHDKKTGKQQVNISAYLPSPENTLYKLDPLLVVQKKVIKKHDTNTNSSLFKNS